MLGRILIFIVCLFSVSFYAQEVRPENGTATPSPTPPESTDELIKHLRAAEEYQISGNLTGAAIENRSVLEIALHRSGMIAIEEGQYEKAVTDLADALKFKASAFNHTNLAIAYLRQNQLDKALAESRIAVSLDPDHVGSRYILGNIYYTKEDYESALPELEWVFKTAPDFEIARALGLSYLKLKRIESARSHFEKMKVAAGNKNGDLNVLLAKFYERTNYPADAERELKEALTVEPSKPRTNFYLGYLLLQNGGSERLDEAGEAFQRELKLTPNDFYSLFFSGVVASSMNEHALAIPFLAKATAINPNSSEGHVFLAQSQIEMDQLQEAEKNLRRAVELEANGGKNTQSRRTHFMLGRLLLKTGRKEEGKKELVIAGELQQQALDSSRSELDRILGQVAESSGLNEEDKAVGLNAEIELAPERIAQLKPVKAFLENAIAQAFNNLGVIATQNSNLNEAIENFSKAFSRKPDFPNLSRNLGIVSYRAGEFEKAIGPLSHRLKEVPEDLLIRKMLGSSYYFIKDFENAVETLKPIEPVIEKDAELAYFYGISLIRVERNKEANSVFNRLAAVSRENPDSLLYAAQGLMISGEFERAVTVFKRVVLLAPDTPKANYFIGQSQIRLNRLADAEKSFARELEIRPGDALSKYHLALTLIDRRIEIDRAIGILKEAIALRYDYADALYQLGKIYLEKGETDRAITNLEKAAAADVSKDYIHYQLSIAYRKVSRNDDADRELKLYQELKEKKRETDKPMPMGANENTPKI